MLTPLELGAANMQVYKVDLALVNTMRVERSGFTEFPWSYCILYSQCKWHQFPYPCSVYCLYFSYVSSSLILLYNIYFSYVYSSLILLHYLYISYVCSSLTCSIIFMFRMSTDPYLTLLSLYFVCLQFPYLLYYPYEEMLPRADQTIWRLF
jgi:hypothetical protein